MVQKLSIKKIIMSSTGQLEIRFSKKLSRPPLKISGSEDDTNRSLKGSHDGIILHDIDTVFAVGVKDDDSEGEDDL